MNDQRITFIVCENGLGHLKRSLGFVYHLLQERTNVKIDIICKKWQIERLKTWHKCSFIIANNNVNLHLDLISKSPKWSLDCNSYTYQELITWEKQIEKLSFIHTSDIVISDNLVNVLKIRSDAILMGSFLWFDILKSAYPNDLLIDQKASEDMELLAKHNPYMLCVDDIAMPAVTQHTNSVGLPWFGQEPQSTQKSINVRKKVAVLTGASDVSNALQSEFINNLESEAIDFFVPRNDIPQFSKKLKPFDFRIEDYYACDLIICRPGIGTITDAICAATPMVTFSENNNVEMKYNSSRLEDLGVSFNLGHNITPAQIKIVLNQALISKNLRQKIDATLGLKTNGFETALNWLIDNNRLK